MYDDGAIIANGMYTHVLMYIHLYVYAVLIYASIHTDMWWFRDPNTGTSSHNVGPRAHIAHRRGCIQNVPIQYGKMLSRGFAHGDDDAANDRSIAVCRGV